MSGRCRGAVRRWIFEEYAASPSSVAIYRIVFALALIVMTLPRFRRLWLLDPPDSFFFPALSLAGFFTGFPPRWVFLGLIIGMAIASVCLLAGWRASWMAIGLALMFIVGNSFDYAMNKIDHDILVVVVLIVMAASGWGTMYSCDAAGRGEDSSALVAAVPLALLALLIGMAMFSAGLPKLTTGWLSFDSQAVRAKMIHNAVAFERPSVVAALLLSIPSTLFWEFMDWSTVFLELSLLPAAFSRRAMRVVLALAVLFHALVYFSMLIFFFSNLITYAAFVDWARLLRRPVVKRVFEAFGAAATRVSPAVLLGGGLCLGLVYVYVGNPMAAVLGTVEHGRWSFRVLILGAASVIALLYLGSFTARFVKGTVAAVSSSFADAEPRPLVLFDGVCGLCNRWVDFVLRSDTRGVFRFAALQSEAARMSLRMPINPTELDSIILIRGDRVDRYSTAVLEVFRLLGGRWSLLYPLVLVPKIVRDVIYDLVASRRYSWFGQLDSCRLPSPEERTRFLERV